MAERTRGTYWDVRECAWVACPPRSSDAAAGAGVPQPREREEAGELLA